MGSPFSLMLETMRISGWSFSWNWCSTWISQRAEAAAEVDVLLRGDLLVAEYQHVVVEVGFVDSDEVFGADWLRDVEADDFGADRGIEGRTSKCCAAGSGLLLERTAVMPGM